MSIEGGESSVEAGTEARPPSRMAVYTRRHERPAAAHIAAAMAATVAAPRADLVPGSAVIAVRAGLPARWQHPRTPEPAKQATDGAVLSMIDVRLRRQKHCRPLPRLKRGRAPWVG